MTKTFFLALILAIAGMGCTKTSNFGPANHLAESTNAKISTLAFQTNDDGDLITTSPANPDNPYDIYGSEHNRVIKLTQGTWQHKDVSLQEIYDAVIAEPTNIDEPIPSFEEVQNNVQEIQADKDNNYHNVISSSSLSDVGKHYAFLFLGYLENMKNMNTFQEFLDSCIALEATVQQDAELSAADKAILLKTASIERYSTVLWINNLYESVPNSTELKTKSAKGHGKVIAFVKKHSKQIIAAAGADLSSIASKQNAVSVIINSVVAYITA